MPDEHDPLEAEAGDEPVLPPVVSRNGKPSKQRTQGVAAPAPVAQPTSNLATGAIWHNKEGDLMWPEMVARLAETGHSPYEIMVQVAHLGAQGIPIVGTIDGAAIIGDQQTSPGEALMREVDVLHMATSPGPAQYELRFCWKASGVLYGRGRIARPAPQVINQTRIAQMQYRAQAAMGVPQAPVQGQPMQQAPSPAPMQPQGFGQPYAAPSYGQMPYGPPPGYPPYGYPQGYPSQGMDPEVQRQMSEMREALRRSEEREQYLRGLIEGRPVQAPVAPTTGLAAPPPPALPLSQEEVIAKAVALGVQQALAVVTGGKLGLGGPPQNSMEAQLQSTVTQMTGGIMNAFLKKMFENVQRSVVGSVGLGGPQDDEGVAEVIEPPNPQDNLPFQAVKLDATWADGRSVVYATDKETGKIDWMAAAMSNPFLIEKMAGGVTDLMGTISDTVKRMGATGPHVVNKTPGGALHAGFGAPAPQQAPQATPPAPPPPPPPASTGFGGGWE